MVWEPMYCKRFRYQATTLLAMINASVERQTPEAQKADLIFYDDFRIKPEYIPARWEPRRKARQEDADEPERDEEAAPRVRGSSKDPRPPAGRKKDARKAKQLIKEALRK